MNELKTLLADGFDPHDVGSRRRIDLLERIKRSLDKYNLAIPLEQRTLPPPFQTVSK